MEATTYLNTNILSCSQPRDVYFSSHYQSKAYDKQHLSRTLKIVSLPDFGMLLVPEYDMNSKMYLKISFFSF